jgi:hypothetical protein
MDPITPGCGSGIPFIYEPERVWSPSGIRESALPKGSGSAEDTCHSEPFAFVILSEAKNLKADE